jgi:hypothetical protein
VVPFAPMSDDLPMKQSKRHLRRYLKAVSEGADRSPLFWWMVEHYEETARAAKGKRMPWAVLCEQYTEFGLTDGSGKPPSHEAARRTWRIVRAEMAKAAAKQQGAPVTVDPSQTTREKRHGESPRTGLTSPPPAG